jgi:hypothetical protein
VFLGAHGSYFEMLGKLDRIKAGAKGDTMLPWQNVSRLSKPS